MRILFCNIAWMLYYKGIGPGEVEPSSGGEYVSAETVLLFFGEQKMSKNGG